MSPPALGSKFLVHFGRFRYLSGQRTGSGTSIRFLKGRNMAEFCCSSCGHLQTIDDESIGKIAKCPKCGGVSPIEHAGTVSDPILLVADSATAPLSTLPSMKSPDVHVPSAGLPADVMSGKSPAGRATQPIWPTVVGVVSILYAVGFLEYVGERLLVLQRFRGEAEFHNAVTAMFLFHAIAGFFLLTAGILSLAKRKSVLVTHFLFAIIEIILCIGMIAVTMDPAMAFPEPKAKDLMGQVVTPLVAQMVYPVFLMIWFALPRHNRQINQW